jgi:myosin-5
MKRRGGRSMSEDVVFIGVLDIFGFESFATNSFEQLCINYTNETLQQHFNKYIFEFEQQLYESENIRWDFISFPDNKETLDLLTNKNIGIFTLCDDQVRFPWSTGATLAGKYYEKCLQHPRFSVSSYERVRGFFTIQHFAGPVCYDTQFFLDKNHDVIRSDIVKLIKASTNPLLDELQQFFRVDDSDMNSNEPSSASTSRKGSVGERKSSLSTAGSRSSMSTQRIQTLGAEFRFQLDELMINIDSTSPHYIRCIKPNSSNSGGKFEEDLVINQLRFGGVLETVRVTRAGFPNRFSFETFVGSFRHLIKGYSVKRGTFEYYQQKAIELVDLLADKLLDAPEFVQAKDVSLLNENATKYIRTGMQIGLTMIFMRRQTYDLLESWKSIMFRSSVIRIQSNQRRFAARKRYRMYLNTILRIQCFVRISIAKHIVKLRRHNKAALKINSFAKGRIARLRYLRTHRRIIMMQCFVRQFLSRKILKKNRSMIRAVIACQTRIRKILAKRVLRQLRVDARNLTKVTIESMSTP